MRFRNMPLGIQALVAIFSAMLCSAITVKADPATQPSTQPSAHLRYDGLYRNSQSSFYGYVRFFEDGTVITSTANEQPEEVLNVSEESLRNQTTNESLFNGTFRGKVTIQGNQISFSAVTATENGAIDYTGEIGEGQLRLDWHSHIDGTKGSDTYVFVSPHDERALAIRKAAERAGASLIRMAAEQGNTAARKQATDTIAADQSEVDRLAKVVVSKKEVTVIDVHAGDILPSMGNDNSVDIIGGLPHHTEIVPDPEETAKLKSARDSAADKLSADKQAAEMLWAKIGREPAANEK